MKLGKKNTLSYLGKLMQAGLMLILLSNLLYADSQVSKVYTQNLKVPAQSMEIVSPENQSLQASEQQQVTIKIKSTGLFPLHNVNYLTDNVGDRINIDAKAMNALSDKDNETACMDCSDGAPCKVKQEIDDTCQFIFNVTDKQPVTAVSGQVTIHAEGVDGKTVSVDILKPELKISKTLFTEPNSNTDHKSIELTNEGDAPIYINSVTIPASSKQPFNAQGVTLSDQAFVDVGDSSDCTIKAADKIDPDKDALEPGKSCNIKVDVAKDARQSTIVNLEGNFGKREPRINIPHAYVFFSEKDSDTPISDEILSSSNKNKVEVDIENASNFKAPIANVKSVNGNFEIATDECSGVTLAPQGDSNDYCKMEIKRNSGGDLNESPDFLEVEGSNLPKGKQYLYVSRDDKLSLVPLSRQFLQNTNQGIILPSGQSYPNVIVYRVINKTGGTITIKDKSSFLTLPSGLNSSDFALTACYLSDGSGRVKATNTLADDKTCERALIYTNTDVPFDNINKDKFEVEEGGDSYTKLLNESMLSKLYVGGKFVTAGGRPNSTNLAAWGPTRDNTNKVWQSLGAFDNSSVINALTTTQSGNILSDEVEGNSGDKDALVQGNALYAGGLFDEIDVNGAFSNAAFWQGQNYWQGMVITASGSGGTNGEVYSLEAQKVSDLASDIDASVYAGGRFDEVGNTVNVNNVSRWLVQQGSHLSTWRQLNSQASIQSHQLNGSFDFAGANDTVFSAFWDSSNDALVLAGAFDQAGTGGNFSDMRIAQWDLSKGTFAEQANDTDKFNTLTENNETLGVQIKSSKKVNNDVYAAGGRFQFGSDSADKFLAVVDSSGKNDKWTAMPGITLTENGTLEDSAVETMLDLDGESVFGGYFKYDDGNKTNLIVGTLNSDGTGFTEDSSYNSSSLPNGRVKALAKIFNNGNTKSRLYLGGHFTDVGGEQRHNIAFYNDFSSASVGKDLVDNGTGHGLDKNGTVNALTIMNSLEPQHPSG